MEKGINKKYRIEITTLTPLSIGAGAERDWKKGADFVVENGKLYRLDIRKMADNGIDLGALATYFANQDENAIKRLIGKNLNKVSDVVFDCPVKSIGDEVKSFVKNQLSGKPIIPGSSIKGSIRSVLFNYLGGKSKDGCEVFGDLKCGQNFMRFVKLTDAEFEKTRLLNTKIFNLYKDGNDWMGGWKHRGGNNGETNAIFSPQGFNTIYEVVDKNQNGTCELMFSEVFCEKTAGDVKYAEKKNALDVRKLFSIINEHTKKYVEKEIAFFAKYGNKKTHSIIEGLKEVLLQIGVDTCVLKMSAGSGFHSITGDWQFGDFSIDRVAANKNRGMKDGKPSAKSRKIIIDKDKFMLMGFVKLRVLTEKEVQEREMELREADKKKKEKEQFESLLGEIQDALNNGNIGKVGALFDQARCLCSNDPRLDDLQKEKEEIEQQQRFESLLAEIQDAMNKGNIEKAGALFDQAKCLCSNDPRLDDLQKEKEGIEQQQRFESLLGEIQDALDNGNIQKANTLYLEALKLCPQNSRLLDLYNKINKSVSGARYNHPLGEFLSSSGRLDTALGNVKSWMKNNDKNLLEEQDKVELKDVLSRIYNNMKRGDQRNYKDYKKWRRLEDYVDANTAKQWFHEITGL